MTMNLIFVSQHVLDVHNKNEFERAKYLCENYGVFVFSIENEVAQVIGRAAREVRVFPLGRRPPMIWRFFFILWVAIKGSVLSRKERVALVYTTFQQTCLLVGIVLKKLAKFTWVADIYDHPDLCLETAGSKLPWTWRVRISKLFEREFSRPIRRHLKDADLVICGLAPGALRDYSIGAGKLALVTNGVDLEATAPRGICTDDGIFRVSYVGFVRKIRGIDTLLEAIAQLRERVCPVKLTLVGWATPEDARWLRECARELGIAQQVEFVGGVPQEEAHKFIEMADVCVFPFPRRKELDYIYPIKVLEYLALGKAVVATRLRGVSSIIVNEENGLLVEPGDPRAMAEAIFRIYSDGALRATLERNARESAREYDWSLVNDAIGCSIERLAERRG